MFKWFLSGSASFYLSSNLCDLITLGAKGHNGGPVQLGNLAPEINAFQHNCHRTSSLQKQIYLFCILQNSAGRFLRSWTFVKKRWFKVFSLLIAKNGAEVWKMCIWYQRTNDSVTSAISIIVLLKKKKNLLPELGCTKIGHFQAQFCLPLISNFLSVLTSLAISIHFFPLTFLI